MRNQEIINKAEMTLASLKSGGMMNPTQASTFIRMVQDTPTILNDARIIPMDHDAQKFEKIGFGQRILRAAEEGKSLSSDERAVPTTSTIGLNAKEVIAEVHITYDTLENNIEKDGLQNTIMQMLAERAAVDIEELIINGDSKSDDSFLAQIDGIRKQAQSHIVDAAGESCHGKFSNGVIRLYRLNICACRRNSVSILHQVSKLNGRIRWPIVKPT